MNDLVVPAGICSKCNATTPLCCKHCKEYETREIKERVIRLEKALDGIVNYDVKNGGPSEWKQLMRDAENAIQRTNS